MDHLLDELLSLEAQCHKATEQCERLREAALHKAKAVVFDAKHLDAGVVAVMGEDANKMSESANGNDQTTSNTNASRTTTRELSIDLIWQAQHHGSDSTSEPYAPLQSECSSILSS